MKSWDLMKKKWSNFFNRGFLINQLMMLYSLILVMIVLIIMLGLSLFMVNSNFKEAKSSIENVSAELATSLRNKDSNVVSNILGEVAITPTHYKNMRNYLLMDQQEYFETVIDEWHEGGTGTFFQDVMRTIFSNYTDVKSIDIVFDDYDYYIHGDQSRVIEKKQTKSFVKPTKELTFVRSIRDPSSFQISGAIYVSFTEDSLTSFYNSHGENKKEINTFIFDSHDKLIYGHEKGIPEKDLNQLKKSMKENSWISEEDLNKQYFVKLISVKDLSMVTLLDKKQVRWNSFMQIIPIFVIGFSVIILLLVILNKVFKRYSSQMEQIVQVTNQVSQGNLKAQVDTSTMQLELKDLADAINQMVVNLNKYIEDIYSLEIKQRDAHMRALQSQINPHFLYNTLEYIRMYALSNQQNELADVVYAFSALLRNNITQEKTTTLKEELDFCEKYVYLYQMRYPDSIAYHFVVDDGLDKFIIPKFIIQPLIENYFVHGIDYERQDNAISVKARQMGTKVEIQITDNGLGMTQERLIEVNDKLNEKNVVLQNSIGISNVYQRIKGFFGESTEMRVTSEENKGVSIVIKIEQ
ncbi:sensor histidine kinase [Vagococcus carniphilus]|nr:sensor histidine kinase [Vagococcus carniphilus]